MKTKTIKVPQTLFRQGTSQMSEDGKTIELSISSDTPYLRYDWWDDEEYWEVLDHDKKSVDLSRIKNGAALLFNHDRNVQLGTISKPEMRDGKCFVEARISDAPDIESHRIRIKEGILKDASVGYTIDDEGECIGAKDGKPIYKFRWFPHEASLVTIPADITVGVGRERSDKPTEEPREVLIRGAQFDKNTETKENRAMPDPVVPAIDVSAERNEAIATERKRVGDIQNLEKHFRENGLAGRKIDTSELAAQFIREGKTKAEFQDAVVLGNFPDVKPVITKEAGEGMKVRDIEKYSISRGILSAFNSMRGNGRFDGVEREMSDEVAKIHGRETNGFGFFLPHDVMSRALVKSLSARTLFSTGSFASAGALVQAGPQGQTMIDLYRNKMHVVAMGAQVLGGLQGPLTIPKQTGGGTAAWLAEDATITASNQTVGQLTLNAHRLAAATAFSTQLLAQASPDIENFVRNDLMTILAVEKDRAALLGSGAAGEPLGIYNTPNIATTVDITATSSITYAEAVQFETNVAAGNADLGSLGYITSVFIRGTARVTPKFANTGFPLWDGDMLGSYPARATNQLTATPSVIFGNWADLIIADWVSPEIIIDPYSLSLQNLIRIVVHQLTDVGIRHPKSFCFGVV